MDLGALKAINARYVAHEELLNYREDSIGDSAGRPNNEIAALKVAYVEHARMEAAALQAAHVEQ